MKIMSFIKSMSPALKSSRLLVVGAFVAVTGLVGGLGAVSVHAASKNLPASPTYVAIGDSVAAGAGLGIGSGSDDAACGRSTNGYPNLLATSLKTSVTNLACGGATASSGLIAAQTVGNVTIPSQIDRAFENGTPDLITITIGANDIHWIDYMQKCYVATCGSEQSKFDYAKDLGAVAGLLTTLQGKLAYTLHEIKDRSGSNTPPKVLITGYYNPVSSTSCLGGKVSSKELAWVNSETANLNKAISQTVAATSKVSSWFKGTYNFATYVPVSFNGHGLCSSTPWIQGMTDAAPLHPNAAGQQQIATTLAKYAK